MRGHIANFQRNIQHKKVKQKAKDWACGEIKSLSRRGSGEIANLAQKPPYAFLTISPYFAAYIFKINKVVT